MNSTYLKRGLLEACLCASICTFSFGVTHHQTKQSTTPAIPEKDPIGDIDVIGDSNVAPDNYNAYLCASYQHSTGQVRKAYETYKSLIKQHPSPHVYNGFFHFLFDGGEFGHSRPYFSIVS